LTTTSRSAGSLRVGGRYRTIGKVKRKRNKDVQTKKTSRLNRNQNGNNEDMNRETIDYCEKVD
jgi:hypothetical protein